MKRQSQNADVKLIVWLLVISCLYKIAVVNNGILQGVLSPLVRMLPLSEISRYTNTVSIVKIPFLGIVLHLSCIVFWLIRKRGKIKKTRSISETCLLIIIAIRFLSEFIVRRGISTYWAGYYVLCIFVILFFYQIQPDQTVLNDVQIHITWSIYGIGFACTIFAILYYFVGLGQDFSVFSFRYFRIGGFMFDTILAGFLYGIALLSGFELYGRRKISGLLMIGSLILFVVSCLLTGSRGSFYFMVFALAFYVGNRVGFSRYVVLGIFAALGVVLYSTFLSEQSISFLSDGARSYKYALAFRTFLSHPIFGVGSNMFHTYDLIYGSNPHNLPLTMLSENGVIGFLPYLIWFISSIVNIAQTKNMYWRWMSISFLMLSMILGVLTNIITVLIMIMVTWGCEVSKDIQ